MKTFKARVVYETYMKDDKGRYRKDRPYTKAMDAVVTAKNYHDADEKIRDKINDIHAGPVYIISVKDLQEVKLPCDS